MPLWTGLWASHSWHGNLFCQWGSFSTFEQNSKSPWMLQMKHLWPPLVRGKPANSAIPFPKGCPNGSVLGWKPLHKAAKLQHTQALMGPHVVGTVEDLGNARSRRWLDRLDSLLSIGPHDHVMRLSLVEYSTPSPWMKIGQVFAGLTTLVSRDRGGASLGSCTCWTFFQKDVASWKQKNFAKLSGWCSASWLNIMCGRKIDASSFTIFLLLVSSTSTVTLIGSLMWMFLQKLQTRSLWIFPLVWPKLPHLANEWISGELQPSSKAKWLISWTWVALSFPKDQSSNNLVHKGLVDEVVLEQDGEDAAPFSQGSVSAISFFHPLNFFGGGSMALCPSLARLPGDTTPFSKGTLRAKKKHTSLKVWLVSYPFSAPLKWNLSYLTFLIKCNNFSQSLWGLIWKPVSVVGSCYFLPITQPLLYCTLQPHCSSNLQWT